MPIFDVRRQSIKLDSGRPLGFVSTDNVAANVPVEVVRLKEDRFRGGSKIQCLFAYTRRVSGANCLIVWGLCGRSTPINTHVPSHINRLLTTGGKRLEGNKNRVGAPRWSGLRTNSGLPKCAASATVVACRVA